MCIRIAIELGLHRACPTILESDDEDQMRRRVFWDCYHLDRNSSATLGRPFGIADADISVQLPSNVHRDPSSCFAIHGSDLATFIHTIRLMQIRSAMHMSLLPHSTTMARAPSRNLERSESGSDRLYSILCVHSKALHSWWSSRPSSTNEVSYQSSTYFDYHYRCKKLDLTRAILDQAWKSDIYSAELLRGCLRLAVSVLSLYSTLRSNSIATPTRGSVHLIFSTGLTIISTCTELLRDGRGAGNQQADVEVWWAQLFEEVCGPLSHQDITETLALTLNLLRAMACYVPDTFQYMQAFGFFKSKLEARLRSVAPESLMSAFNTRCEHGQEVRSDGPGMSNAQGSSYSSQANLPMRLEDPGGDNGMTGPTLLGTEAVPLPQALDEGSNNEDFYAHIQDFWSDLPSMDLLTDDLLDYTWEAPILWDSELV